MSINNNFYKPSLEIMKKLSIFIILVIVIGAIFYFWQKSRVIHVPISLETHTWAVSFQFSESEYIDYINIENTIPLSLANITQKITQEQNWEYKFEDYGDMGILVTQIKNKENGQAQKYWQYFIEEEQPQISADKYFPPSSTRIEWKFIESEF